jgi:amino acid transporter
MMDKKGQGAAMAAPDTSLEKLGYKQELKRGLSLGELILYGLAFMAPLAPAAIYGYVVGESSGLVPLTYLCGVVAMIFTALSYARMSREFPIAGSVYNYVQRGINPHVGFIGGWLILIDYFIVPSAIYSFTGLWLADLVPAIPYWAWVVMSVALNTIINILGIDYTSKTNFIFVGIQFVLFVIFMVLGVMYILQHGGFTLAPFYQEGLVTPQFVASATSIAVLSFLGFDAISTLGEEAKKPELNIGRATLLCLVLLGAMFIMQTYVAGVAVPDYTQLNPDTAFFDVSGIIGGNWMRTAMIVALVCANIAAAMVSQASVSRIFYSLSRDKMLPRIFGIIHPKYKTPWVATLFSAGATTALSLAVYVEVIITLVNFGALSSFILLNFTVFWYFFVRKNIRGVAGVLNYILLPFIGVLIIGWVWSGLDSTTKLVGLIWLAIGLVYGAIKSKGYKKVPEVFTRVDM